MQWSWLRVIKLITALHLLQRVLHKVTYEVQFNTLLPYLLQMVIKMSTDWGAAVFLTANIFATVWSTAWWQPGNSFYFLIFLMKTCWVPSFINNAEFRIIGKLFTNLTQEIVHFLKINNSLQTTSFSNCVLANFWITTGRIFVSGWDWVLCSKNDVILPVSVTIPNEGPVWNQF